MPDPQTPNLQLYIPLRGADVGIWDTPANANFLALDAALGQTTTIGLSNVNVTLSSAQYACNFVIFTGALSGNIVVTFPPYGRNYILMNSCTNTSTFSITCTTGFGTSVVLLPSVPRLVVSDSVNMRLATGDALIDPRVASVHIQTFTASGTYTPSTGMLYCIIECVGGGGGGGSALGVNDFWISGGGGGGGGYARKKATASDIGVSQVVTISGGGVGGGIGPASGGLGGSTSVGALCFASGGSGGGKCASGGGGANAVATGGDGGGAIAGDVMASGAPGGAGEYFAATGAAAGVLFKVTFSGYGGSSYFGGGAAAARAYVGKTNGIAGGNYGGGGSGGATSDSALLADGGAGAGGIVVITEFCSI